MTKRKTWVLAVEAKDIPQREYVVITPWDRYRILAAFAKAGDEPVRRTFDVYG